jgi:response regulator RpfG family c-di-GMP phosphodiesterase
MNKIQKQERFKILMVDDEENILSSLKRLFFEEDYDILTATSGIEGIEVLKKNDISVVISDQKMPAMSGTEFLAKARKISPDTVRIVLTGYADAEIAIEAINKAKAYAFITKPWDDNGVILTIKNAVERYGLIRENTRLTEFTKKRNEELKNWNEKLKFCVEQQTVHLKKQNEELKEFNEKLVKNLKDSVTAFSNLIELRDKTVSSHSNNVSEISTEMAKRIGLGVSEIEAITIAAQLHDIGKIGIPDIALLKDFGELTREEMEEYQKHPIRGQAVVDFVEPFRTAGVFIRHHHEWYNGSGFPDSLKGNKIPVGSRIIAMADQFDRAVGKNPGCRAAEKAFNKVQSLLGKQFDPGLYKVFREAEKKRISQATLTGGTFEAELSLMHLMPGMIISKDVKSGTGLLLLSKGVILDDGKINALMRRARIDPLKTGVHVWMEKG